MTLHLDVSKKGYAPTSVDATITFGNESVVHLNEVINPLLSEVAIGTDLGLSINPIYFDYRKWNIRPDAANELDKIVAILKANPKMKIALGSHTDSRGTDEDNQLLSERRAKSSVDYIVSKGISRKRITGKGYGEAQLKVSDAEIKAVYLWVEQEKMHQLNRRTEFVVVKM
jgi:outer membrane protein OmpA-like peptidoglycan-associated protein